MAEAGRCATGQGRGNCQGGDDPEEPSGRPDDGDRHRARRAVSKDLPEERLKPVWPGLVAQFGAFKSIVERREGPMQERQAVELILAFEKQTIVHRTVFDGAGQVAGLVFRPLDAAVLAK
jgi:hypothetical protein